MFESDENFNGNKIAHAPYLQRSASAPAVAEHVSDALLPNYTYEEAPLGEVGMDSMYYGSNGPSRLNPRLPGSKRPQNGDEGERGVDIGDLLDESKSALGTDDSKTKSLLSSLIIEAKQRTPMDLIQEDFPSTPSTLYSSSRLQVLDEAFNNDDSIMSSMPNYGLAQSQSRSSSLSLADPSLNKSTNGSNSTSPRPSLPTSVDTSIDGAALSMQQLYISGEDDISRQRASSLVGSTQPAVVSTSQPSQSVPQQNVQQQAQQQMQMQGVGQQSTGGTQQQQVQQQQIIGSSGPQVQALGLRAASSGRGVPLASQQAPSTAGSGSTQTTHMTHSQVQPLLQQQVGNGGAAYVDMSGQMMQAQQQVQYIPVDPNGAATGMSVQIQGLSQVQGVVQTPNGQQQLTYYVQQPVYLDHNGQPIYVGGAGGPYQQQQQQMVFATGPDGTEQVLAYLPYAAPPHAPQQLAGGQAYWQTQDQSGAVFVGGPGGQALDVRRVVYNPVTAQYTNMAISGNGALPGNRNAGYSMASGNGSQLSLRGGVGGEMDLYGQRGMGDRGGGMGGQKNDMRRGGVSDMRDDKRGYRDDRGGGRATRDTSGYGRGSNSNTNSNSAVNPMRDPLVDEFRATYGKSRQWELLDLCGHVVAFCQDQHGSRFIQQRLEVCSEADKQQIFEEIIPSAHSLMTDVFGNYVLQKLFEYGTPEQCEMLSLLLSGQAVQLAMQMYGCRVVQKALEYVSTQRLITLVSEFENPQVLLRCVHDSNGNHVIQKCIEIVSKVAKEASTPELSEYLSSRILFIINAFQGRVKELSSHPYGCRVVQRILEHCASPQKSVILEELRKCCSELVQDCYGNYVIQFVMQHGWEADRAVLIKEVQAHLLDFSQHKFASNVVEKCLQYASKRDRDEMIWTIINVTFDLNSPVDAKTGHCVLESMVRDPYANYVVQKVIDVSDERQRGAIMRYVKENIVQLRRYTYGKHIIVRLEKITNEKF